MIDYLKTRIWEPLRKTLKRWQQDDGPLLAGAVAYYLALSLFPLLLILISALGTAAKYTDSGANAKEQILRAISEQGSPGLAESVRAVISNVERGAVAGGPLGLVALLGAAMAIFVQFDRAFDRIWNVPQGESRGVWAAVKNLLVNRLGAFVMLLGVGLFVVAVFVSGVVLSSLQAYTNDLLPGGERLWWWIELATTLILNSAALTIVYRTLPKIRIKWSEAWRGAIVAAFTWELGRQILASLVIGGRYSAYGVIGALLAIMLWANYAVTVVFLGAEYIQTFCAHCNEYENSPP